MIHFSIINSKFYTRQDIAPEGIMLPREVAVLRSNVPSYVQWKKEKKRWVGLHCVLLYRNLHPYTFMRGRWTMKLFTSIFLTLWSKNKTGNKSVFQNDLFEKLGKILKRNTHTFIIILSFWWNRNRKKVFTAAAVSKVNMKTHTNLSICKLVRI